MAAESTSATCFHCALPIPADCRLSIDLDGDLQPVCCPGCKAVAELIRDSGMQSYYALRDAPQPGAGKPADTASEWRVFNTPDMQHTFAEQLADDEQISDIYAGGMYCSACGWLIERSLRRLDGVRSVDINPLTHRVRVRWHGAVIGLGDLLQRLADIGYRPQPLASGDASQPELDEQRNALKRLLVASLGMMQVMMFAIGLYAGEFQGMDADMQRFLRWVSLTVATPVVLYSARPFFSGAWRGLVARMPGMDLPVALAIGAAYLASVYSTLTDGPAVWFDSVTMFTFFLTLGRYLEMRARHRSIDRSTALSSALPNTACRVESGGDREVPLTQLCAGDVVRVRSGDAIPADGIIVAGRTSVDESLLTGESAPQSRDAGSHVAAGSVNLRDPVDIRVTRTGNDTALGAIGRLSQAARYLRPSFVTTADRIASYLVIALLVVAAAVAGYWYINDPERAFVITLSVLVVTCPCALALATPAAFAAAGTRLAELGLLVTRGDAIESLAKAEHFVFDKTGTLTYGLALQDTEVLEGNVNAAYARQVAAALERASTHPLAEAFAPQDDPLQVSEVSVHPGAGISGTIDGGKWRIGDARFTGVDAAHDGDASLVYLASDHGDRVRFTVGGKLRPDAQTTIATLQKAGLRVTIASGDRVAAVQAVAAELGIDESHAGCSPQDKLALIHAAQAAGEHVVAVGDGINDAPVLAGADVSIAPAHGALLAQTQADVVMLGESLRPLTTAWRMARQTLRIVRQNLAWAVLYNLAALPLAAAGFVPPWAAAIGMSASSLVVVLNALRLNRYN